MCKLRVRIAIKLGVLTLFLASGCVFPEDCDFVAGGGFIFFNGSRANFGVGGGCKDGTPTWGHLEYIDHGADLKVHGTRITGYNEQFTTTDSRGRRAGSRYICGTARTNLFGDVNFIVRANDTGEPGTTDEFDIQLTQGTAVVYTTNLFFLAGPPHKLNDGNGGGGNIQLHGPTAGDFDPTCTNIGA